MKVFLTGATGYIGSVVAERLLEHGHEVLGLARSDQAAAHLHARGVEPLSGDLADAGRLIEGATRADAVIHLAQSRFDPGGDFAAQMQQMGQQATRAMGAFLRALSGSGKTLMLTGGTGAYGDTGDSIVDEDTPLPESPMTAALAENERRVLTAAGVRGMAVRPAIVYGRGGGPLTLQLSMARQFGGVMFTGDGENALSFVHVDDVADLYVRLLERGEAGMVLNAVAEPWVTQGDVLRAVSEAAGFGGVIQPMPEEMARGLAYGGGGLFARNMRVSARKARAFGWTPRRPSVLDDLRHGSYAQQGNPA
ncbi:NAD-dependent epimerase/dehydratase family protein [Deinococcus sp. SDU3-2]|uniref:NAD-dependent epimerase/dehydratase family protein n=1 Tax=Deinococcus terrestris TaxID=2651870 RepID=A0A7X1TTD8_9DEIO|nr:MULTISPECIES: NAD-dependent epimerase/dehydratase family protein [Deinococcus]MPY68366.1 NAD-dependent epimerase/dehydratase family protein [Deinococcus terrestris]